MEAASDVIIGGSQGKQLDVSELGRLVILDVDGQLVVAGWAVGLDQPFDDAASAKVLPDIEAMLATVRFEQ